MTFVYVLIMLAALVISYRFNPWIGLALTVLALIYIIYSYRPNFYAIKARKAYMNGKFMEAKHQYKKAIDTGRAKAEIRIEYADALMRTGDFEESEQVLNNILRYKLKPNILNSAKLRRCMVYFKLNNFTEAYDDAIEMYNEGFRSTYLYGLLGYFKMCKSKDSKDTLNFCMEAYEYNSDDRDITDNLAVCYYYRGEYNKAKELSDKIMESNPQFVEAYYHGALIEYTLGNYDKAMEYIDKIPGCRWSTMTTVSKEEVEELKTKTKLRLGEK